MPKLSERIPMQLSCEEGWAMDTVDLAQWLKELAQQVEAIEQREQEENRCLFEHIVQLSARIEKIETWLSQIIILLQHALEGEGHAQD